MGENPSEESRTEADDAFNAVNEPHLHGPVANQPHFGHPPGGTALQRRHHGSGSIFSGCTPALAASQATINSV